MRNCVIVVNSEEEDCPLPSIIYIYGIIKNKINQHIIIEHLGFLKICKWNLSYTKEMQI